MPLCLALCAEKSFMIMNVMLACCDFPTRAHPTRAQTHNLHTNRMRIALHSYFDVEDFTGGFLAGGFCGACDA